MRNKNAAGWGRGCGLVVMVCVLAVMGRERGWAQGSEPGQSQRPTGQAQAGEANSLNSPRQAAQSFQQSSGQAQGEELPDAPGENKKEQSTGPAQQIEDKTKQVGEMTEHAATAGLIRARDWESTWIEGVYIRRDEALISPTAKQREEIYLRQTLTTPGAYMKRMFGAGIDQARGVPSQWDDGWGGYAERFASREGQFITANTLAALGNAALGYEVRYDKCKCDGLWQRTRHAFMRNLMTYDRSEEHLHPQWALYGGAFGGGVISTAWKPSPKNAWANGGWAVLGQVGYGTLLNFVTEFSKEINRKQGVR